MYTYGTLILKSVKNRERTVAIMRILYPNAYVDKVEDIQFKKLYDEGYRGILFDVDNTLVPFDQLDAHDALVTYMDELQTIGFKVGLVSNNSKSRVEALNKGLNLAIMPNAMKPFTFRLRQILKLLKVPHKKAIFVGDQLFTDVWVGNRLGLYTVLVKPIQTKEQMVTRIKRRTEKAVLKRYLKKEGRSHD
jgi:HAD superfamily phosphatase (TIGR01668 family)